MTQKVHIRLVQVWTSSNVLHTPTVRQCIQAKFLDFNVLSTAQGLLMTKEEEKIHFYGKFFLIAVVSQKTGLLWISYRAESQLRDRSNTYSVLLENIIISGR